MYSICKCLTLFLAIFLAERDIEMADRTFCLGAVAEETTGMSGNKQ